MASRRKSNNTVKDTSANSTGVSVYIGPSIKGVIQHGTIIVGTPAEAIKDPMVQIALQKRPDIKTFIVNATESMDAKKRMKTPGDKLYKAYNDILRGK